MGDVEDIIKGAGIGVVVGSVIGAYIGWRTGDYAVAQYLSDAPTLIKGGTELRSAMEGASTGAGIGLIPGLFLGLLIKKGREYKDRCESKRLMSLMDVHGPPNVEYKNRDPDRP